MKTLKQFMRILNVNVLNKRGILFIPMAIGLTLLGTPVAFADNAVKLKVLVVTTSNTDLGLAYIKPFLEEMGVGYDVVNSATQDLTAALLSPNGCAAVTVGCVGNYNGIMLTDSFLTSAVAPVSYFTPSEWDILHAYETNFHVREVVLSGYPQITYWDPNAPWGVYLDYGLAYKSSITPTSLPTVSNAKWTIPTANSKTVFEYINKANPLPITDFAYTAKARNDGLVLRDGTVSSVTPLLQTPANETLVSVIQYKLPAQTIPVREVMLSSIANASFLTHSQVLGYEFVNWVTQGVFVGGRFVYMTNHLDDLFLANDLWDVNANQTSSTLTYRLSSADITNAVKQQTAFRIAHKTATDPIAGAFMLDFPFNGAGAVVNPAAAVLKANTADTLVTAVIANKTQFRFMSHTYSHADMDKPVPANTPCDYPTLPTVADVQLEITKNRTVWTLLGLPDQTNNNRVLVTGNHSGLKDRKCTEEITLATPNPQVDDVPYVAGANPLFMTAAANAGVNYLASDTSQINQDVEQYMSGVDDGSATTDRVMLPRYPTNIFFNVMNPTQLVSEYNYIFHDRFVATGQDPCTVPGAICATRTYADILAAETTAAVQHMLSFKMYPHFFHQMNVANYGAGKTLQFDWLNSVYTAYEKLFKLPVKNPPYYQIGDKTNDRLIAKSATVNAKWDRTAKTVTLSASKTVNNLLVTGLTGGELYGGQSIRAINVTTTPQTVLVDQALTK
jgi:hypothetical protein